MTITFKNHFQTEKKFLIKQKLELQTFSPKKKNIKQNQLDLIQRL